MPSKHNQAASCQRSSLGTSSMPPSSGCTAMASFHPCSGYTMVSMPSCAAAPTPSPSESGRDQIISISCPSPAWTRMPNQAVRNATADSLVPARWPSRPLPAAVVPPHQGGSCSQTPWCLRTPSCQEHEERMTVNLFFPTLQGFLYAPGWSILPSLHSSVARSASGDHHQGSSSDLTCSEVSARGSSVESLATPVDLAGSSGMMCCTMRCTLCYLCSQQSCLYL